MARILIVEDEEKIARFVTLELEHEGYQVEHAADGRTAVDLALERDYDLILLDVLLPQLNGMEVLRRVRKHKDVPVIMVTARDAVMDKVAGLDAGADDYLTKPFAIEELFARIRVALKRSESMQIVEHSCFYSESEYAEYIRSITAPDLLIIDDLGAERGTDFALERVHSLVDTRISANKPMIVTTNIDITDMGNCADLKKKRTFDRIMPATFAFAMKGTSYRMKQAQKSYKTLKDLLLSEKTIGKDRNTNENDQNL